jgi:hypothetical protein
MSSYIGNAVKNGLVLYLDAANSKSYVSGSSVWRDLSGNNNSGSLTNGPTFSSDGKGSIVFDGTNDHVILARPSIMSGSQVSFCVWVNITLTRDGSIIWLEDGNDARYFSVHLTWGDNSIYFDGGNGTGTSGGVFDRINKSTTASERSGWHYWCFTKNSSTGIMRIYLDGKLWHSGTGQNSPVAAASVGLINKMDTVSSTHHHRNAIASIKFYNRELSPAEILENYNATKGRFDTPIVINSVQPRLVTNGLVMSLDAANGKSFVSGSGTWFDLTGNNNNGTLTNGPTYTSSFSGAIVFDGSNDCVVIQDNNVFDFGTGDFAVCGWMYFRTLSGSPTIFLARNYFTGNNGALLYSDTAGKISVYTTSTFSESNASISINRWHYIVWTRISGISYIYNNAVLRDSRAFTFNLLVNNSVVYGLDTQYNSDPLNGYIASAKVYSGKGLTSSEVLQNYNATKGRFGL